jgi:large conductance mechanosensitive channel
MLKGFRYFIAKGNVIDLAVAVVIGAAFGAVVSAFVKDLLTPLIAAIFGKPDFAAIALEVNGSKFMIGDFINNAVNFLLVSIAIYFFVVVPSNKYKEWQKRDEPAAEPTTKKCDECLSEIPLEAKRCAHCGQPQPAAA